MEHKSVTQLAIPDEPEFVEALSPLKKAQNAAIEVQKKIEELMSNLGRAIQSYAFLRRLKLGSLISGGLCTLGLIVAISFTIIFPGGWAVGAIPLLGIVMMASFYSAKETSDLYDQQNKVILKKSQEISHLLTEVPKLRWNQAKAIMDEGALAEILTEKTSAIDAICSRIYSDKKIEHSLLKALLIPQLSELSHYEKAPFIAPLMYLIALAAQGKHDRGFTLEPIDFRPLPQLTILLTHEEVSYFFTSSFLTRVLLRLSANIADIDSFYNDNTGGFYDNENGLFISLGKVPEERFNNIHLIFHEAAHFAAREIMKNESKPYKATDVVSQGEYQKMAARIKAAAFTWNQPEKAENYAQWAAVESFKMIFTHYADSHHESELFVMVPQVIALLGYKEGYTWLISHVPDLVVFYENHFNPACITYLKTHHVQKYLDIDPAFTKILETSAEKISIMENKENFSYGEFFNPNNGETKPTNIEISPGKTKEEPLPIICALQTNQNT